jgi:hypothetical protein
VNVSDVDVSEVVEVLQRTPMLLRALLEGLPEPWLKSHEGPGTFGPREVLGHLIHGEKTDWVPRVRQILEDQDRQPFAPFDRRGFGDVASVPVVALLDEFETLRRSNVAILSGLALSDEQLEWRGLHPELGPVTLGELLATWVAHDLDHVAQVVRVMGKRYVDEVGPWRRFLRILDE